jgi:hypothetical protein
MQLDKEYREFVYDKIKDEVDYTFEEWSGHTNHWKFHPVKQNEDLVAVVSVLGNEVHVNIDQAYKGRWLTKGVIKKILGDIISKYGSVITCVGIDNEVGKKFLARLGFKPSFIDNDAGTIDYILEEPTNSNSRVKAVPKIDISGLKKIDFELVKLKGDLVQKLFAIEDRLKLENQAEIPIRHFFAGGLYAREMDAPKDTLIIGKMHKYKQINVISKGDISVLTENGWKRLKAPFTFESPAGVKRAGYTHEDTIWTTFVATEETDIETIDEALTIGSYKQYIEVKETLLIGDK